MSEAKDETSGFPKRADILDTLGERARATRSIPASGIASAKNKGPTSTHTRN